MKDIKKARSKNSEGKKDIVVKLKEEIPEITKIKTAEVNKTRSIRLKNSNISGFPQSSKHIICSEMIKRILINSRQNSNVSKEIIKEINDCSDDFIWLTSLPNEELLEISHKLKNAKYESSLNDYFNKLFTIANELVVLEKNSEILKAKSFVEKYGKGVVNRKYLPLLIDFLITRDAVNNYFRRYLVSMGVVNVEKNGNTIEIKLSQKGKRILSDNSALLDRYWEIRERIRKTKN